METVTVTNLSHTLDLSVNLLSVSSLTAKGALVAVDIEKCTIYLEGKELATAIKAGSLYNLVIAGSYSRAYLGKTGKATEKIWHCSMAHPGDQKMRKLMQRSTGIEIQDSTPSTQPPVCKSCILGK